MTSCVGLRTLEDAARQCSGSCVASHFGSGRSAGLAGQPLPSHLGPAEELLLLFSLAERLGHGTALLLFRKGASTGTQDTAGSWLGPAATFRGPFFVSHIREDITAVNSSLNLTDTMRGTRGKHPSWAFKFEEVSPSSTHLFCLPHTQHLRGMLEEY